MINVGGGPDNLSFDPAHMGSITFDGTDDRIQVGSTGAGAGSIIVGWSEISVSVWAWIEPTQGCPKLVSTKHAGSFDMAVCLSDDHNAALTNWFYCDINGGYVYTPVGSIIPYLEKWTHYVVTNRSGSRRLYMDGELLAEDAGTGAITAADYNMCFGNREDGARPLEGKMASVYLYNRVLSAAEVKQNYEATKSRFLPRITKSGLVGNWDAGDPECYVGGTTCKDTANGTTATFMNWDAGEAHFNSANGGYWEFDGTDEYIQCSDDSVLQPQSFSVEAWVYDHQPASPTSSDHYLPIVSWANEYHPAVWTSYHSGDKQPIIYLDGPDYRYFSATAASVVGWHHVVFTYTYDDITTGAFYVDGVSMTSYYTPNGTKASTDTCRIGRAGSYYYTGDMGLVRIYDTPLSAAEILDNYNATKGRFT